MLCLYPALHYQFEKGNAVPAVAILALAYALQFAMPVFFGEGVLSLVGGYKSIDEQSLTIALLIAIAGMAAFLLVSYSNIVKRLMQALPTLDIHLNRTRALLFCIFFGGGGLLASPILGSFSEEGQTQFSALFRVLQTQSLVAIGVLAWLTYTSPKPGLRLFYYGFVALAVIDGLSGGFLEASIIPIGLMFASQWIFQRRVNKALVVVCAAALLLLNPVKTEFRENTWYGSGAEESRLNKAVYWLQTGFAYWSDVLQGREHGQEAAFQLVRRTSMIDAVAHVYESTPVPVPYFMGETYAYFAYSLIPRIIWPDKPLATANRTLAVAYSLTTTEGAERSTFGISIVGEGYANFGWFGAVGIMCILALVLQAIQRIFATPKSGPGGYALFLAFFVFFLNGLGTSAEILLGNLLQSMLFSYLFIYWVKEKQSSARQPIAVQPINS
jgi:hypothetical protein